MIGVQGSEGLCVTRDLPCRLYASQGQRDIDNNGPLICTLLDLTASLSTKKN